jgi:hypothetical protein
MRVAGWFVVAPPALNDDLSFAQGVEDIPVEQLVAETCVEAFDVSILPRAARFYTLREAQIVIESD